VVQRAHPVERVGQQRGTPGEAGRRLGVTGVGVAQRGDHAVVDQPVDQLERSGQFGSQRDRPHRPLAGLEQFGEDQRVRLEQVFGMLGTAPRVGEERPLQVGTDDVAARLRTRLGQGCDPPQLLAHLGDRRGDQ
jgi:hypothetical protein